MRFIDLVRRILGVLACIERGDWIGGQIEGIWGLFLQEEEFSTLWAFLLLFSVNSFKKMSNPLQGSPEGERVQYWGR